MVVWQLRTAAPFTWTVQAPHNPNPQPNFVPVSSRISCKNHNSGMVDVPVKFLRRTIHVLLNHERHLLPNMIMLFFTF